MMQKFLLLALLLITSTTAFSASRRQVSVPNFSDTALFSTTRLHYRDHDDILVYENAEVIEQVWQEKPAFLPRHSQESTQQKKLENLLDAEMIIGRIAMLASIVLLSAEVVGGKSILEQFSILVGS
mmetsp:Transcript_16285/g.24637  ORF Transcript_16285/g.24637 Transcript_16285/m.24637 type:complete len:126 (+) Transcript_16285:141-518(+)